MSLYSSIFNNVDMQFDSKSTSGFKDSLLRILLVLHFISSRGGCKQAFKIDLRQAENFSKTRLDFISVLDGILGQVWNDLGLLNGLLWQGLEPSLRPSNTSCFHLGPVRGLQH